MIGIVNGFLLRGDQVLMAKRSAGRASYPDMWSVPGGHIEAGETPDVALKREVLEETGATVLTARATGHRDHGGNRFHMFAVTKWAGTPTLLGDEHSQLRWMTLGEAQKLTPLALPSYRLVLSMLAEEAA